MKDWLQIPLILFFFSVDQLNFAARKFRGFGRFRAIIGDFAYVILFNWYAKFAKLKRSRNLVDLQYFSIGFFFHKCLTMNSGVGILGVPSSHSWIMLDTLVDLPEVHLPGPDLQWTELFFIYFFFALGIWRQISYILFFIFVLCFVFRLNESHMFSSP